MPDVIIVGAGLAGLACAKHLMARGVDCVVLEASDDVGGRVRTDEVAGFRLDRGFQVLLTAYPEAQAMLDYGALQLRAFEPGALIQCGQSRHRLSDPWRRPWQALRSLVSPVGTLQDKLRVARMRHRALHSESATETSTLAYLQAQGFSSSFISSFFRPFFGGIFLDRELSTSSRMAEFVFRMMALGDTSLPSEGMGAISRQLASGVTVRLNSKVSSLAGTRVTVGAGEQWQARAVVVAAEGTEGARLASLPVPKTRGVSCLYFAAEEAPIEEPILMLNGDVTGAVNSVCVPSAVAPAYAPAGAALISVTVLGLHPDEGSVRQQLAHWFGSTVQSWRHLRTYRIPDAQPVPTLAPAASPRLPNGLHVCGDYRESASIQGALVSGRRAAESVLQTL